MVSLRAAVIAALGLAVCGLAACASGSPDDGKRFSGVYGGISGGAGRGAQ